MLHTFTDWKPGRELRISNTDQAKHTYLIEAGHVWMLPCHVTNHRGHLCAGLENDEYTRKTDGYLPTAEVAFIDEIFKANSAILNALLTLLNERLFDNGNQRLQVPLLCLVSHMSLTLSTDRA